MGRAVEVIITGFGITIGILILWLIIYTGQQTNERRAACKAAHGIFLQSDEVCLKSDLVVQP